jgi:hypothetical protein
MMEENLEFKVYKESEWICYLFGNDPDTNWGLAYTPQKGGEPNWFIRWMMKICLGCTWVRRSKEDK